MKQQVEKLKQIIQISKTSKGQEEFKFRLDQQVKISQELKKKLEQATSKLSSLNTELFRKESIQKYSLMAEEIINLRSDLD